MSSGIDDKPPTASPAGGAVKENSKAGTTLGGQKQQPSEADMARFSSMIDEPPSHEGDARQQQDLKENQCDDRFMRKSWEKEEHREQDDSSEKEGDQDREDSSASHAESILQAFHSQPGAQLTQGVAGAGHVVNQLAQEIADRVLVPDSELNQNQEVMIQIKGSVLKDTQIRLSMDQNKLQVSFSTGDETSFLLLNNAANKQDLQSRLKDLCGSEEVVVEVTQQAAEGQGESGDSQKQSRGRGYFETSGEDDP